MSYLDYIENYEPNAPMTQFEKVKIIIDRARDLHDGKSSFVDDGNESRKKTALAQLELMQGKITPEIHDIVEQEEGNPIPDFSDLDDIDEDE